MSINKLYDTLKGTGLYTGSFEEFDDNFKKIEYRKKVYDTVYNLGMYTKDLDSFEDQYLSNLDSSNIAAQVGATVVSLAEGTVDLLEEGQASVEFLGKQFENWSQTGKFEKLTVEEKDRIRNRIKATGVQLPGISMPMGTIKSSMFEPVAAKLNENIITYDDTISEALLKDDVDWTEVGSRITSGTIASIPSLVLATTPAGLAMLGASAAGNKWEEEYEEDPEKSGGQLFVNAVGTGLIETLGEYVTGKIIRASGIMKKVGTPTKAISDLNEGAASKIVNVFGLAGLEGGTETAQNLLVNKLSEVQLGKKIDWDQVLYESLDEGIIGTFSGGGVSTIGAIGNTNSVRRKRAEMLLRSPESRKKEKTAYNNMVKYANSLINADKQTKQILEQKIKQESDKIYKERINTSKALENLKDTELMNYAKNIEKLNEIHKSIKNPDNKNKSEVQALLREKFNNVARQNKKILNDAIRNRFKENLSKTKKIALKKGIKEVKVFDVKKFIQEYKKTKQGKKLDDNELEKIGETISGYFDSKTNSIVINRTAAKNYGRVTVASHELLHPILNKVLGSTKTQAKAVQDFKSILSSKQRKLMDAKMKERGYTKEEEATEYFNVFLDAATEKRPTIKFEKKFYLRVGDFIKSIFGKYGIKNINFETGDGVFNFLKAYKEGIDKGQFTQEVSDIIGDLDKTNIQNIPESREASQNVQRIYDQRGVEGAMDIISEFSPIVNNIVSKYQNIPGFDAKLLRDEINTGSRGILDMIMEYNVEKAKGAPLAAYINSFIKQRSIEAANRILKTEFETDITEAKGVAVEEVTTPEVTKKPKARKIKPIDLVDDVKLKEKYTKDVQEKIKDLDINNLTFKNLKDLSSENTAEIFGVATKKVTDPAANLTKQEKENALTFIRKNALDLIDLLPQGAITEAASESLLGTSTGVPKSLLNKFYTKQDRITKGAGLSPYTKNKNISKKDFLEAFGVVEGKKSTDFGPRTPEAQAVKSMMSLYGKLATNTIVRQELLNRVNSEKAIQNIGAGKSATQFSKENNDLVIKLKQKYYKLDTIDGVDNYIKDFTEKISPLFEYGFLNSTISVNAAIIPNKELRDYARIQIKKLNKNLSKRNPKFAKIKFDTKLIRSKSAKQIQNINKRNVANFTYMWNTIYDAVQKDKSLITPLLHWLTNSQNEGTHPHRLGAEYLGGVVTDGKLYFEHALQNARAYRLLMEAAVTQNKKEFNKTLSALKNNYKLIALTNKQNNKIDKAGLKNLMVIDGEWNVFDNNWWERYFNKNVAAIDGGIDPNSIIDLATGKTFGEILGIDNFGNPINNDLNTSKQKTKKQIKEVLDSAFKQPENITQTELLSKSKMYDGAIAFSRSINPEKGISVFDFDDTLARTQSKVIVTMPDGKETKIDATEFAKKSVELQEQGAEFNFEEFKKVIKGKKGPFFELAQKIKGKFGNKDIFILTARPQEAANAIHVFLKGSGLDIRQDNIIGLEDGRPEAKAEWILGKVNEGYNNFLFADDAYKNVKAVQDVLNEVDVKSDVQQARIQFSKDLNKEFNNMLSDTKGINPNAVFSDAAARVRGAKSDSFWKRIFIPPSAEDFMGLMYHFVGKGKKGDQHLAFIKKALIDPFARGFRDINAAKQRLGNDYNELNKSYSSVKKKLLKATDYNNFTFDAAVRVYLWDKNGIDIPGISKRDLKALTDIVKNDNELKSYADQLGVITKQTDGYIQPDENWVGGTIQTDLNDINTKVNRSQYLAEWIENKNKIFDKDTLNKIEALYGTSFKEALNDILYRMENGTNRTFGQNKLVNEFTDWINNSVGTIMFLNARSAVLQTISSINFINWSDNNPLKVAKTIANFPQFAKDFAMIFNSDMLKQRRKGLQTDVSASEIVNQAATSKNKVKAMISYLLKKGFVLTQAADSFAISLGGASFYRNRYDTYRKQGLSDKEANDKAFGDFQETSEVSQQSARPDLISEQQAGPLGRLILAFQNTPMQYTRLIKKAALDLANNRGDAKTNISKILYYGAVQNFIFTALQSALFALMFSDEEEEKEKERYANLVNNMADTILRGTGVYGAALSTIKNVALEFIKQEKKGSRADHAYTMLDAINISPPIGSKARKIYGATQAVKFNRDEIKEKGFSLDNPAYEAVGNVVSATVNVPLDRAIRITNNTKEALNKNNEAWQRIALLLGWNTWDLGIQKDKVKEKKKKKNKKKQIIFW